MKTYAIGKYRSTKEAPDNGPGYGYTKEHFAVREGDKVVARFNTSFEAMYYMMWLDSNERKNNASV